MTPSKLGACPIAPLTGDEHPKNNLPDVVVRWKQRARDERQRPRTAQSFCVSKADIAEQSYDLSLNRYKEVEHEGTEHRPPLEIIADLERLEKEINAGLTELRAAL